MRQSLSYFLCLRGMGDAVIARRSFEAESDAEAASLAAVLLDAASDVVERCELWCGERQVLLPKRAPTAAQANARLQRLVIDHELALRDSRRLIAESRRLLERLHVWSKALETT